MLLHTGRPAAAVPPGAGYRPRQPLPSLLVQCPQQTVPAPGVLFLQALSVHVRLQVRPPSTAAAAAAAVVTQQQQQPTCMQSGSRSILLCAAD